MCVPFVSKCYTLVSIVRYYMCDGSTRARIVVDVALIAWLSIMHHLRMYMYWLRALSARALFSLRVVCMLRFNMFVV